MKPAGMITLVLAAAVSLLFFFQTASIAGDAAWVGGDMKVEGLWFSGDPSKTVIRKPSDFSAPWTILGSDIYYLTGNVGIGTMAPAQKLSVAGSIESTTGGFKFPDGTTQTSAASVGPIGDLTIAGNLILPTTTATTGIITSGANRLIHTFGTNNIFVGINAGNLTLSGYQNTAIGSSSLSANTTGYQNTAGGQYALLWNTTGNQNTASGNQTLSTNSTGSDNTASGSYALYYNETGSNNTANGSHALLFNTTGSNNTASGYQAGNTETASNANTTGDNNTFVGAYSGPGTSSQLTNATAIGYKALVSQNNSLVLGGTGADAVNVGIGTQTPSQALEVVGVVKATSFQGDGSGLTNLSATSVTNGVYTTGSYADPAWITSMAGNKITGTISSSAIPDSSITTAKIVNGAVSDPQISGPISANKLDLSGVQKKYGKVAVVAQTGGDYADPATAMSNFSAWCGTPSSTNPCLLKIMPGIYDIGLDASVIMQQYIDIEGSGENVTMITGAIGNGFGFSSPVVQGASNAEIRFLTIKSSSYRNYLVALANYSASPKVTNVTLITTGGLQGNCGVYNINGGSSPVLNNVTINIPGGGGYGVFNAPNSSLTLNNVTINVTGGGTGVHNNNGISVKMTNTAINVSGGPGGNVGIWNGPTATSPSMANVVVNVSGSSGDNYGVWTYATSTSMFNSTVNVSGGANSYGVYVNSASAMLNGVYITATGGSNNYGLYNTAGSGSYTVNIDRSTLAGTTNSIRNDAHFALRIGASNLAGSINTAIGAYACAGVYNQSYVMLTASCI